ncbi:MAG: FliA/WhiG family RNA polymerase sigma factor [Gammaproteobacteria bacterium]|nr:FliA/WhiG family RNA polymerase sigma factor [Gammaproteobacteria bacterium]
MFNMEKILLVNEERDRNIADTLPLVRKIAYQYLMKLPETICLDDLIQAGTIGLIEAVDHYDSTKGAAFSTYAAIRIKGSIIDELRKGDWAPRSVYKQSRDILQAICKIESEKQEKCSTHEIALELGMSREELDRHLRDMSNRMILAYDAFEVEDQPVLFAEDIFKKSVTPLEEIDKGEFEYQLNRALSSLPERERTMMILYFREDYNLKVIGAMFDVSESRASQIISDSVRKIKQIMAKLYDLSTQSCPENYIALKIASQDYLE